jgi:hypothetical protein
MAVRKQRELGGYGEGRGEEGKRGRVQEEDREREDRKEIIKRGKGRKERYV